MLTGLKRHFWHDAFTVTVHKFLQVVKLLTENSVVRLYTSHHKEIAIRVRGVKTKQTFSYIQIMQSEYSTPLMMMMMISILFSLVFMSECLPTARSL